MVVDMTDTNELVEKLKRYEKFNADKMEQFTEQQNTIFKQKGKEFFLLYEIFRNLHLEVDSIGVEIINNTKEFRKSLKYFAIATLFYGLLSWFFELSDKTSSIVAVVFFLFFVDFYLSQQLIKVTNEMRIISKNEFIKHYSFLLNNSVSSSTYGDCQNEYNKLKEKKSKNFNYEFSKDDKITLKIFNASVSSSIIEDITGEYFDDI